MKRKEWVVVVRMKPPLDKYVGIRMLEGEPVVGDELCSEGGHRYRVVALGTVPASAARSGMRFVEFADADELGAETVEPGMRLVTC